MTAEQHCDHCGNWRLFHRKDCPVAPGQQRRDPLTISEAQGVKVHEAGSVRAAAALTSPEYRAVDPVAVVQYRSLSRGLGGDAIRVLDRDRQRLEAERSDDRGHYIDDDAVAAGWASLPWDEEVDA